MASRGRKDSQDKEARVLPNIIEEGEIVVPSKIESKRGAKLVQSILTLTELLNEIDINIT